MRQHSAGDFNSHAHVERDYRKEIISLRAEYFNSHAHVERDVVLKTYNQVVIISTHTLTWSVTVVTRLPNSVKIYFNSHAHVERDPKGDPAGAG